MKRTGLLGAALAAMAMVAVALIGTNTKPAAHPTPVNDHPSPLNCSAFCNPGSD